jgi:hypothetical protein
MHRRWRRQRRRIALEPNPFSSLFERPSQHGVDLADRRGRQAFALSQTGVEIIDLGAGQLRRPDVAEGRVEVEADLVAVLRQGPFLRVSFRR